MLLQIQLISLDSLILLFYLLWSFSFFSLFFVRNFILMLIAFELMFLSISMLFCIFSFLIDNVTGQLMSLFILGIVAAESAIGLAIYIILYDLIRK